MLVHLLSKLMQDLCLGEKTLNGVAPFIVRILISWKIVSLLCDNMNDWLPHMQTMADAIARKAITIDVPVDIIVT